MAVPFQEVIIHTIIDVLRHKAEDLEKDEKVAIYANLIKLSLYMSYIQIWTRIRGPSNANGGVNVHKMQNHGKDKVDVIKTRFKYILSFARWGLPGIYTTAVIGVAVAGMSNIYTLRLLKK